MVELERVSRRMAEGPGEGRTGTEIDGAEMFRGVGRTGTCIGSQTADDGSADIALDDALDTLRLDLVDA
jgi:hypothetical protein